VFPAERRRQIVKYVKERGGISISTLSSLLQVSEMTIHRDLSVLEGVGLLWKTRGGALAYEEQTVPVDYQARLQTHPDEKDLIGRKAVEFIKDGETIFLESGTTSLSVARHCVGFDHLTVYTNGPMIEIELVKVLGVEVHSTGGLLSRQTMAYVGPQAEHMLDQIRPDKCFIGAHGITVADGVMDPFPLEASIKRKIVEVSQEVYLVATSDKFGRLSSHISAPIQAIDVIIMNQDIPKEYCQDLAAHDIRCVIA
jgi:DeoR family fructose operon transcriptional repressor